MSSLVNPSKVWAPRTAGAAVEWARLALVPTRSSRAPRAPFAVLVFLLLGAGVVGLLMFNTHMQQSSFYATSLQQQADSLAAQRQALEMELEALRDPQRLAEEGRKLGMVAPGVPSFINLATGKITGIPTAGTPEDAVRVNLPANRPGILNPKPKFADPPAPPTGTGTNKTGQTASANGQASTRTTNKPGRNGAQPNAGGAAR